MVLFQEQDCSPRSVLWLLQGSSNGVGNVSKCPPDISDFWDWNWDLTYCGIWSSTTFKSLALTPFPNMMRKRFGSRNGCGILGFSPWCHRVHLHVLFKLVFGPESWSEREQRVLPVDSICSWLFDLRRASNHERASKCITEADATDLLKCLQKSKTPPCGLGWGFCGNTKMRIYMYIHIII